MQKDQCSYLLAHIFSFLQLISLHPDQVKKKTCEEGAIQLLLLVFFGKCKVCSNLRSSLGAKPKAPSKLFTWNIQVPSLARISPFISFRTFRFFLTQQYYISIVPVLVLLERSVSYDKRRAKYYLVCHEKLPSSNDTRKLSKAWLCERLRHILLRTSIISHTSCMEYMIHGIPWSMLRPEQVLCGEQ